MFSLKKNQIIITVLVVMICVAGYLNYIETKKDIEVAMDVYDLTMDGDVAAIVLDSTTGQEVSVMGQGYSQASNGEIGIEREYSDTGKEDPNASELEPGAAVFVSASSDSSFFVQAKLSREQDRSKQKETLSTLIGSTELDTGTKALCAEAIVTITGRMESESAAEAALAAKGFGESYVRIDDNWVEVIINKSSITEQELAQLEDILIRTTGATVDKIRLSSVKNN